MSSPMQPHLDRLIEALREAADEVAPRFVNSMPQAYFDDTTEAMRLAHLKAILAAEASGDDQTVTVRDEEQRHVTFISNHSRPGQLSGYVRRLPDTRPLVAAQVHTARDGSRVVDIFRFGEHEAHDPNDPLQAATARALHEGSRGDFDDTTVRRHLESCGAEYLRTISVDQALRHLHLAARLRNTGDVLVHREEHRESGDVRLTIGLVDLDARLVFERVSRHLGRRGIDIERAHLDRFRHARDVTLVSLVVRGIPEPEWPVLERALRRIPHLDDAVLDLADTVTDGDLVDAEILYALARLAHQRLIGRDARSLSRDRVLAVLERHSDLAKACARAFHERFDPARGASEDWFDPTTADTPAAREVFSTVAEAIGATLRTNLRLDARQALALRIVPSFLDDPSRPVTPFGVFYVVGRNFEGFHVRFRDIARGGVRIVRTRSAEQHALEAERHYEEAYGLAAAQQDKNKDIPEGGSKAVILTAPAADVHEVGRAFADALLDLVVPREEHAAPHRDHYGHDEHLYLGPDENVSDELITWIVERARRRGHPMPDAFMSSKPGAGINHKQFGVTSEGVTVFLEHALRAAGIDPRERSFTVKMTGGPDGDVAGNEIRILHREFGDNARIVAIADGSGSAEDPRGLAMDELLRLVEASRPIVDFDPARLGPEGRVTSIDRPHGTTLRDELHHRVIADAFVPAGGRPATIDDQNWTAFLDGEGRPSSRVIVEGANLFITPEARTRLSAAGVSIVKDSSANKAGVICSSYEIVASMLFDEAGFLAIKERYVDEVVQRLRGLAELEARTLFRERRHKPDLDLPTLSARLSREINRTTDAIAARVETIAARHPDRVLRVVLEHLPATLRELGAETVVERIPQPYRDRIVASSLASRMVYREGTDWMASMSEEAIAALAERYLAEEERVRALAATARASTLPDAARIADLLEAGGVIGALRLED